MNAANTRTMPATMMAVSVGIAKSPYSSSPRLDRFHMLGDEFTTAPQLLQVKISYSGACSSDLDACIATLQTGQGFNGNWESPMLVDYLEFGQFFNYGCLPSA